jgi:hypothetical protein
MLQTILRKLKRLVRGKKKDNWGAKQIKEIAKLKGKLILM